MNEQDITAEEVLLTAEQQEEQNVIEQTPGGDAEEAPKALTQESERLDEAVPPQQPEPSEDADEPDPQEEIRSLRGRVAELTDTLARQEAAIQRMTRECAEFSELFPDTALARLPGEVWESVAEGIPLAAAYALCQVRQQRREALAAEVNARNRAMSGGGVSGTPNDHLSPGEVRKMTAEQVHNNYSKILESMKLWS